MDSDSRSRIEVGRTALASGLVAAIAVVGALLLAAGPGEAPAARGEACPNAVAEPAEAKIRKVRHALACLVNETRARRDVDRLRVDKRLQKAAQRHTRAMVESDCFGHLCPGEPDLEGRIRKAGYLRGARRWRYAENTGCAMTAQAMIDNWLASKFHRRNIVERGFEHVGIGVSSQAPSQCGSRFGTFTAVFGWRKP